MPKLADWCKYPGPLMVTTALSTPLVIGAIVLLPKGAAHAAPDRLAMTALVFAAGIGGFTTFVLARRRYRDDEMMRRYGGASLAVRDTLSFLRNEQRLARRGRLPVLIGSMASFAGYTLAHWPQFAMLAPYRTGFGALSLGLLAAVPVLTLRYRTHVINAWFIRRYLKESILHLGYRPPKRRFWWPARRGSDEPAVTVTGPGMFRIGGFDWRFDDLVKNAVVFGQVGSGKTVCVLNSLLYALIASGREPGCEVAGLVLDAKGDFLRKFAAVCEELGRGADLVTLDPAAWDEAARTSRSVAWNPLDNDDDALEIATRLIAALRLLGLEQGNEGSFFLDSAKAYLRHAISLVRAAAGDDPASIVDVYRLAQEGEEETPLYHSLLAAIGARFPDPLPIEIADAIHFFEREWAKMADRQKSGVRGTITQLLDEFLVPPFREIFTGRSTVAITDVIDRGKLLYVHMPAADRERMSRLVNTLIKLEFEKHVLMRPNKARPSFMLIDEFQSVYTVGDGRGDSDFFERSRESNHANIVAAQNISAFLKRTRNAADVRNFLGNCAVKIFLRNTEEETNRWASALFGMRSEIVVNSTEQAAVDGGWSRRRHTSYSRSTRMLPLVPPEAFARLAIPLRGDPDHQHAESIVHLGSRSEAGHPTVIWPVNPLV